MFHLFFCLYEGGFHSAFSCIQTFLFDAWSILRMRKVLTPFL